MRVKGVRPQPFVTQLRCDRCGVEAQHDEGEGFNNFLQIEFDAGWGSDMGDGNHVELDICHACLKQTLGPWLRVSPAGWAAPGRARLSNAALASFEKQADHDQASSDANEG